MIDVLHMESCDQRADVLTKSLARTLFEEQRNFMFNREDFVCAGRMIKSYVIRRRREGGCSKGCCATLMESHSPTDSSFPG